MDRQLLHWLDNRIYYDYILYNKIPYDYTVYNWHKIYIVYSKLVTLIRYIVNYIFKRKIKHILI